MGISEYQTAHGRRWQVQYTRPDGRRTRKRGFGTKDAAQAWLQDQGTAIRKGTWVDPRLGKVRIDTLADMWLATQAHLKESYRTSISRAWQNHVQPKWGQRQAASILRSEVAEWVASMDHSPTVVKRNLSVLKQILDIAVADRMIESNPAAGVPTPRKTPARKIYLTASQVKALADEVSKHSEIVWVLATTGLRWSELAGLQVQDVDLTRLRLRIERAAVTVNGSIHIGTPKTHERRVVAMPAFVADMLRPLIAGRGAEDYVWPAFDGQPLRTLKTHSWFHAAVKRLHEKSGFPVITPHDLRHVAAGLLVSSGANVKVVQRQLGHKSAAMTLDVYADLFDEDLGAISQKMGVAFAGLV